MKTRQRRLAAKTIASLLIFSFPSWNILSAQPPVDPDSQPVLNQPLQSPESPVNEPAQSPAQESLQDSINFLMQNPSLSPAESQPDSDSTRTGKDRDYERYAFEDAIENLRPEYAGAVILKSLASADIDRLRKLNFETGLIVLHGEIILFTSGNENEIGLSLPVQELIKKADFVSHVHTSSGDNGPRI